MNLAARLCAWLGRAAPSAAPCPFHSPGCTKASPCYLCEVDDIRAQLDREGF